MSKLKNASICVNSFFFLASLVAIGQSQVVQFRLEATDLAGTPIESITLGEEFYLKAYTQHVNGFVSDENSGVFAGYLDVSYDGTLASVAGPIRHSEVYQNGKSGDTSTVGLLDNVGGFSSSGDVGFGLDPIGLSEQFLFRVPIRADGVGEISFVGSESGSYPAHDVLVYGLNEPVLAKDIDFGEVGTRINFGAMNVHVVPEPKGSMWLASCASLFLLLRRRR
ncbi:hypothetical protein ACFL2H_02660 [Planctomycetota bacterium]